MTLPPKPPPPPPSVVVPNPPIADAQGEPPPAAPLAPNAGALVGVEAAAAPKGEVPAGAPNAEPNGDGDGAAVPLVAPKAEERM